MAGKTLSRFGALSRFPPFSLSDLLCAIDEWGLGLRLGIWIWLGAFFLGFRTYA